MSETLLKWVAEELLGWKNLAYKDARFSISESGGRQSAPAGYYGEGPNNKCYFGELSKLESWHGIGLVIDAMARQSPPERWERLIQSVEEPHEQGPWWSGPAPWDHVFAAARKAVEGGR